MTKSSDYIHTLVLSFKLRDSPDIFVVVVHKLKRIILYMRLLRDFTYLNLF